MNVNEAFPVSPAKRAELLARLARLNIDPARIEESFTRGGGKGGQKINKTSNAVVLRYAPLGLVVKVQRERQRSLNRFLALRELADQIEERIDEILRAKRVLFGGLIDGIDTGHLSRLDIDQLLLAMR